MQRGAEKAGENRDEYNAEKQGHSITNNSVDYQADPGKYQPAIFRQPFDMKRARQFGSWSNDRLTKASETGRSADFRRGANGKVSAAQRHLPTDPAIEMGAAKYSQNVAVNAAVEIGVAGDGGQAAPHLPLFCQIKSIADGRGILADSAGNGRRMGDHADVPIHGSFHPHLPAERDDVSGDMSCDDKHAGEGDQVPFHCAVDSHRSSG